METKKVIDKILYWKLCLARTNGHIGVPLAIAGHTIQILILLKLYEIANWMLVTTLFFAVLLSMIILGHVDIKKGIINAEMSLSNKYNPEIQRIINNTEGEK